MMKRILLLAVIAVMIGTMFVVVGAQRQDDDRQRKHDYVRRQLEPDTSSANWKPLSDDVGLMVYTDRFGVQRGTVYVRIGEAWVRVAVEGPSELGPRVLPLGQR